MVKGVTSTGFEFSVNEDVIEDWRFVTAIADAESDDDRAKLQGTAQMVRLLLDRKSERALMEHVKREDGIVPTEAVQKEVVEIFNAIGEENRKKSQPSP